MTLLCADIGNSDTTLGLIADGVPLAHWRVATDERRTADEWAVLLRGLLAEAGAPGPTGIAVCATVPAVLHEWRDMLGRHFGSLRAVVVEPGVRTGVPVLTDNPREVGADRIVNALAAAHDHGGPAIVVDFGTATTYDVVNARGQYVGGAIVPGIEVSLEGLGRRGAQLRKIELMPPRSVIARNTVEALQSGVLFGTAAQVEGLVARMVRELGARPRRGARDRHRAPGAARARRVLLLHRTRPVAHAARPGAGARPQLLRPGRVTRAFRRFPVAIPGQSPTPRELSCEFRWQSIGGSLRERRLMIHGRDSCDTMAGGGRKWSPIPPEMHEKGMHMAQKVHIQLVDDFDGSDASETVAFGLDGATYEIDLNEKHAAKLRDVLAPYVGHARKAGGRKQGGRRSAPAGKGSGPSAKEIREWARDNGWDVPDRGRVAAEVREAYAAAH